MRHQSSHGLAVSWNACSDDDPGSKPGGHTPDNNVVKQAFQGVGCANAARLVLIMGDFRGEISLMGEIRAFGILVGQIIYMEWFEGFANI